MDSRFFLTFALLLPYIICSQALHLPKQMVEKLPNFKKSMISSPETFASAKRSSSSSSESEQNFSDDYFDDDYYTYRFGKSVDGEEEESRCSEDMYWHARSFKCVPYDCPGGNQYRDKHSGDCILKFYGSPNYHHDILDDRNQLRNSNSRVKSSSPTKFRLPFGLTIKAG